MNTPNVRAAWGRGLATIAADGTVLDTWYPDLGLGDSVEPLGGDRSPRCRTPRRRARSRRACGRAVDRPRRPAGVGRRRVPAPAPAVEPAVQAAHDQPRRRVRVAHQRRLDQPRARRRRSGRCRALAAAQRRRRAHRSRSRQVPADDRLRGSDRRAHRRRRSRAPRRPPGLGHDRDARGVRQLQRGHARARRWSRAASPPA